MANEFIARNGLISQNNSVVTGSLIVTQGITGSLQGTATTASYVLQAVSSSRAVSSSYALTASLAPLYLPLTGGTLTGDLSITYFGNRTFTMQANNVGGTEIRLLPNTSSGYARINVGNTTQPLDFQMNSTNVMRLTQAGFVGIGTTSPNATLDVSGSVIISGPLTVTGSLNISGSVTATNFTGSLFGTSSFATTASFALNAGTGGTSTGLVQAMTVGLQNIF